MNGEKCKNTVAMMQYNVTQTAFVVLHLGKTSLAQVNYRHSTEKNVGRFRLCITTLSLLFSNIGSYIHVRGGKILGCKFSILLKEAYETEMKYDPNETGQCRVFRTSSVCL